MGDSQPSGGRGAAPLLADRKLVQLLHRLRCPGAPTKGDAASEVQFIDGDWRQAVAKQAFRHQRQGEAGASQGDCPFV